MADFTAYLEQHFWGFFALCFGWVAAVALVSVLYRRSKGKAIFADVPDKTLFIEKWTSGRSLRSLVTKLGGAHNCLLVVVTQDALVVRPHFPFTLLFLPEVFGLDCMIPRSAIRRVQMQCGLIRKSVAVEFEATPGQAESLELSLRAPEEFQRVLAK